MRTCGGCWTTPTSRRCWSTPATAGRARWRSPTSSALPRGRYARWCGSSRWPRRCSPEADRRRTPSTGWSTPSRSGSWRRSRAAQSRRFDDPALGPMLARRAAEIAALWSVPLQFHTGFGDEDIRLPGADPTLLRPLLHDSRTEACPIVLLHCYPFVRGAAVMAGTYPQVYLDLSLAIPLAEPIAAHLVREALGLCPAGKLMAASDGHSFPEMHWWGAIVWRRALATVLGAEVDRGDLDQPAADEISSRILGRTARSLYRLRQAGHGNPGHGTEDRPRPLRDARPTTSPTNS